MAMPYFFLILLFFSSTLHACDASRLRFFQSSNFVSRINELHSMSQGIWSINHDQEGSFDKNNNDNILHNKENIIGIEMLKGMKRDGSRLVMEFPMKEKVMNSKENEVGEDMVVMDYAQPHRKPPIHNEKP
ncbi:uncharacterized protein LOC105434783 [Cucumis sativus]|uniref:Uncharacterized protein n=1 Tax=Cucumis sativus TaxID=3659 RepID=A0A0A0L298_CUCSA|nr:uncharacterized protein LOC105434783 [Cucumis sativus]KGN55873.1 hypothetical protein Csa_010787 [Cucumis sativus]